MLLAKPCGVTSAQASEAEHPPHDALARAKWPMRGVLIQFLFGPLWKALCLGLGNSLPCCWIKGNVLGGNSPFEHAPDRVYEMAAGERLAALDPLLDCPWGYFRERLI